MVRRRLLSDEEEALWRAFVRSIRPLQPSPQGGKPGKKLPPRPAASAPAGTAAASERTHTPAPRRAPPAATPPAPTALDRRLKQRVARGREPIDARIDLHGMTQRQAHAALSRFLHRAQADGARTVLVVTGKGSGRAGGADADSARERGVLKRQVPMWLGLPEFRPFVVGFDDAHVGHGGEGALYVRLRHAR